MHNVRRWEGWTLSMNKTEVHYEQHHHVARHRSDCVLCLRRRLGDQSVVGQPSRLRGVKEAKPESWRGVSDAPRQLFTDQSVWRDGEKERLCENRGAGLLVPMCRLHVRNEWY